MILPDSFDIVFYRFHNNTRMANKFSIKRKIACNSYRGKKGQYRIISEILLFLVGILITSFVIIDFGNVESSVKKVSLKDQLESVGDTVATAIVKVANVDNATIRLSIPDKVSNNIYKISITSANGGEMTLTTLDGTTSVKRQIFNIDYDNTNSNNHVINNSDIVSSAGFVEVVKNEKITLVRSKTS